MNVFVFPVTAGLILDISLASILIFNFLFSFMSFFFSDGLLYAVCYVFAAVHWSHIAALRLMKLGTSTENIHSFYLMIIGGL